jgi:hypothetical protein
MAANFYRYIVALPLMAVLFGIKATDRVKSFRSDHENMLVVTGDCPCHFW